MSNRAFSRSYQSWFTLGVWVVLFAAGCNSTNPVAPTAQQPAPGSTAGYTLTLTSNPAELTVGATTPATLSIVVKRTDNGQPPPSGSKVALSTDIGSFGVDGAGKPLLVATVALDTTGKGQTNFFASASAGTAHILAQIDTSNTKLNLAVKDPVVVPFFLTAVSPSFGSADGGTLVTITGSGFLAPVRVSFGTVVATVQDVQSGTIKVVTPHPAAPVDVGNTAVVDILVTNNLSKTPATDTLTGAYTYVNGPSINRPVILAVSPASGPNAGGTTVDIRGTGFDASRSNLQVFFGLQSPSGFNGLPATILAASPTDIQVSSPAAGSSLLNQQVDILVRNLATSFETIASSAFKYVGQQIAATAIDPPSGPYTGSTTVTITGQGFAKPVSVVFGGAEQTVDQTKVTATRIIATTVPVAVSACKPPSGPLTVKNLNTGETAVTSLLFSYTVPQPTILQVAPTSGVQAGGETLTVTGQGFGSNLRLTVGGSPATNLQSGNGTTVTATVPAFTGTFDTVACDDNGDGQMGMRNLPKAVDVQVTDLATGCTDTFTKAYTYNPADVSCRGDLKGPPVADFTFTANFLTVSFADRSTGGTPSSWQWDFGDPQSGPNDASTLASPTHTFSGPGTFLVQLTAKNSAGMSSAAKQVSVTALKADFTYSINSKTVTFTDRSTGPPVLWSWSFGDGQTSSQQNPVHTYASSGTYNVVLQVASGSTSNTTSQSVIVP